MRSEVKENTASRAGFLTPCTWLRGRTEAIVGGFKAYDSPQLVVGGCLLEGLKIRVETAVVVDGQEAAQFLREAQQFNGFRDRSRERLVDYDVAASSQALPRNRKVRLIRGGNYHQANRSDGQQFVDAADRLDIGKHSCRRITGALYDGRKPQSGHGADDWRMKASPGESEPNQPDVDHPHDPQRSACGISFSSWNELPRNNTVRRADSISAWQSRSWRCLHTEGTSRCSLRGCASCKVNWLIATAAIPCSFSAFRTTLTLSHWPCATCSMRASLIR